MKKLNVTFRTVVNSKRETLYPITSPDSAAIWLYTDADMDGLQHDTTPSGRIVAKIKPAQTIPVNTASTLVKQIAQHNVKSAQKLIRNASQNRTIAAEVN